MRRWTEVLFLGLALLASPAITATGDETAPVEFSGSGEAGTGSAAFRLGYYENDDNGDGNPFVDEELTVIEPIFIVSYNITDRLAAWGQFSYDNVSSASIDRLSKFPNQSGASGDNYLGFDFGSSFEIDEDRRVSGFFSTSSEYDYDSYGVGGDFAHDFAGKDTTLKFSLNGFYDRVDVIRFNGNDEGTEERFSASTTLSWYQVLSPKSHAEFGGTFGYQAGFLETAYNAVVIEAPTTPPNPNLDNRARGIEITEELPATRLRGSLFGSGRYSLMPGASVELASRFYLDNWGVFGFSAEPRLHYWWRDKVGFRLGYRYYVQTAADDYRNHFRSVSRKRTQDPDLGDFDSHGLTGSLLVQPWESFGFDLTAGYTFRDDGIDQLMLSVGIRKTFDLRPLGRWLWGP